MHRRRSFTFTTTGILSA